MSSDWAAATAIAAIAIGLTIYYTAKASFAHKERMAKIQKGGDPDQPAQKDH